MIPLTPPQRKMLEFIRAYIAKNGQAPTVVEISEAMNQSFTGDTRAMLKRLEKAGAIRRTPGARRGIVITGDQP